MKAVPHRWTRPALVLATLLSLLVSASRPAAAQSTDDKAGGYTEITGSGQTLFAIAIPRPLGGDARRAKTLQQVLANDLTLIGLFKVLNPKGFLANLKKEGTAIKAQAWLNVGAQAVVKARVSRSGGKTRTDWFLYDVSKGEKPVLRKTYSGRGKHGVRRIAHRFGDDIVHYYTKERGVFTTRITFAAGSRRRRRSYIYVMDFDGYGVHRFSRTGSQNVLPAWSPSGKIAWTSLLWKNPDLYISSGGRAKRISKRRGLNTGAAFSPGGGKIALTLSKDGNAELYVITTSGKIVRRLTHHGGIDTSPTWSPDGSRIAFVSNRGGSPQIYVMSSGGGSPRRLTFKGNYNQEPDWCPNKKTPLVAFTGRDSRGAYDIFTVDAKSNALKRLTQGQGSNKSPSWAPNGRLLVFSSSRGGLWIMNSEGLNQHRIHRGGAQTPDWSKR